MGIPQTSVSRLPAIGVVGSMSRPGGKVNGNHVSDGISYPGRWATYNGDKAGHPSAAPTLGTRGGVVLKNEKSVDGTYADKEPIAILEEGFVIVDPEVAVTRDTQAFARTVVVTTEEKGALRPDAGGAVGGVVLTAVTAVNAGTYTVALRRNGGVAKEFSFIADASATTAEIATGIAAAIDADADLVATNPTATTVLVVGTTITDTIEVVTLDARLTAASNAAAFAVPALFRTTASTGAVELEVFKSLS